MADLVHHPKNPNQHSDGQLKFIAKVLGHQGWRSPLIVSNLTGFVVCGNGRLMAARSMGLEVVPVDRQDFVSEADEVAHMLADNKIASMAENDSDILKEVLLELDTGELDMDLTGFDSSELEDLMTQFHVDEENDAEPKIDQAKELQAKWGTKLGQLWELGDHRIACGDSTAPETLAKLMGEEKAALLHADPPYGMGKEKDGVANDNLYRDKLDAFQMDWWRACRPHLEDNASSYIWGNAPDLWRLWYVGGLADSERLTVRNEIIWDKPPSGLGDGQNNSVLRSFGTKTERCLFFILGEQGFNNNADNYWEGWEPVRAYLDGERKRSGLTTDECNKICGKQNMTQSAFTKGGFRLISKEDYEKLRDACNGNAFKREHDELKREHDELKRDFYATRAYFDNTHENMTDVWQFPRVSGEERHGHATPKPVEMMGRCIKSSAPSGALVVDPFLGSGTTLIACENLGRKCRAIELAPEYVAVAIERWVDVTGKEPQLVDG